MKIVKILIVLLAVVGIVILGFVLMTPTTNQRAIAPPVSRGDTLDLNDEEVAVLQQYIQMFSDGWDNTAYHNALSFIQHPDRLGQVEQMGDMLVSGIMAKLDSVMTEVYRSNPPQAPTSAHRVLGPAYDGMAAMCADFDVTAGSDRYARLMADREVFDAVYSFGNSSFVKHPEFNLRLVPSSTGYSLDWNENMHDYAQYRSTQDAHRRNLQNRLERMPDLQNIDWMRTALDRQRFENKISNAETTYRNAELRQFAATLRSLPSDRRLVNDRNAAQAVAAQLGALESNLPPILYSAQTSSLIASVRARLTGTQGEPITR